MISRDPIFVHSLWRAGGGYIFSKFRSLDTLFCYREPIHETVLLAANNRTMLTVGQQTSRNPGRTRAERFDFFEVNDRFDYWKSIVSKPIVYDEYFDQMASPALISFYRALITSAPLRSFFLEYRTSGRIGAVKEAVGGQHLYLWRHPWDQWWSMVEDRYFSLSLLLIANAENVPSVLADIRDSQGIPVFRSDRIRDELAFFEGFQLSAEGYYQLFFALWCLSFLEGQRHADFLLSIDRLASDPGYRDEVAGYCAGIGMAGLSFDDCLLPRAAFGASDVDFHRSIQNGIFHRFERFGYDAAELDMLRALAGAPPSDEASAPTVEAIGALRSTARDLIDTGAERVRQLQSELALRADRYTELKQTGDEALALQRGAAQLAAAQAEALGGQLAAQEAAHAEALSSLREELTVSRQRLNDILVQQSAAEQIWRKRDSEWTEERKRLLERLSEESNRQAAELGTLSERYLETIQQRQHALAAFDESEAQRAADREAFEQSLAETREAADALVAQVRAEYDAMLAQERAVHAETLEEARTGFEGELAETRRKAQQSRARIEREREEDRARAAAELADEQRKADLSRDQFLSEIARLTAERQTLEARLERAGGQLAQLQASWIPGRFWRQHLAAADYAVPIGQALASEPVPKPIFEPPSVAPEAVILPDIPPARGDGQTECLERELAMVDEFAGMETQSAGTLDDVLAKEGGQFVDAAYVALLGRLSDAGGRRYYLNRLAAGYSKASVVVQLALSPERQAPAEEIVGLKTLIRRVKLARLPVFGGLYARLRGVERDTRRARELRAIKHGVASLAIQVESIKADLNDCNRAIWRVVEAVERGGGGFSSFGAAGWSDHGQPGGRSSPGAGMNGSPVNPRGAMEEFFGKLVWGAR